MTYSVAFLERAVRILTGERNEAKKDEDNRAPVHSLTTSSVFQLTLSKMQSSCIYSGEHDITACL